MNAARMFGVDENYILVGNGAAELINVLGEVLEGNLLTVVPVFNEYVRCFKNCTVLGSIVRRLILMWALPTF